MTDRGRLDGTVLHAAVLLAGALLAATSTTAAVAQAESLETPARTAFGRGVLQTAGDPCADCPCPADAEFSGVVDVADILVVVGNWGSCDPVARPGDGGSCADCPCPGDVNRDGTADVIDILVVLVSWGPCLIDNDCTAPGECSKFVFGCNGNPDCACVEQFDGSIACQTDWSCDLDCVDGACPPGFHCVVNTCCGKPSCAPDSALCAAVGACCLESGCLDAVTLFDCQSAAGLFLGPGTECTEDACVLGACCFVDDACVQTTEPLCVADGGSFLGPRSSCVACVGACCMPDGSCTGDLRPDQCTATGGTFEGFARNCDDVQCPVGACCMVEGRCDVLTEDACAATAGVFLGIGTDCSACRYGACCVDDDVCVIHVEEGCQTLGGMYLGLATECFQCTIGACCLFDGSCVNNNLPLCDALGGAFQGPLTNCGEVECPAFGACCVLDGSCANLEFADCEASGGTFEPGVPCEIFECPPIGACCLFGQFCTDGVTEERCADVNGEFLGEGTKCSGQKGECTVVIVGACCLDEGGKYCLDGTTEEECLQMGGFFPGEGTLCEMAPCD